MAALAHKRGMDLNDVLYEFDQEYCAGLLWGWDGQTLEQLRCEQTLELKLGFHDGVAAWNLVKDLVD